LLGFEQWLRDEPDGQLQEDRDDVGLWLGAARRAAGSAHLSLAWMAVVSSWLGPPWLVFLLVTMVVQADSFLQEL
jgi:hypothetical protein